MESAISKEEQNEKLDGENIPQASISNNEEITHDMVTPSIAARIERNRQRALLLKQSSHPYAKINVVDSDKSIVKIHGGTFVDTGGGFLLENIDFEGPAFPEELAECPPPIVEPERPTCLDCQNKFPDSFLLQHFSYPVCDQCRDNDYKHALITRTEAKSEYLLKDCDFDKREPILKYISRKNPHNIHRGEMKLYLQLQVEEKALQVWGSEEELEKERVLREEKKELSKMKKYRKEMKALRMNVRSSLFDRTSATGHTHDFGPETYNTEDDTYSHTCRTCAFYETFEKM